MIVGRKHNQHPPKRRTRSATKASLAREQRVQAPMAGYRHRVGRRIQGPEVGS